MTAPQYAPQQQYPPQQPAFQPGPQFPAQYPQQPQQFAPQQQQQQQQQYPTAQGYPAPQMAPPAPTLVQGSIDDFYSQPSTGGGKSLSFAAPGVTHVGIVTRALTQGDVQQQTDTQQRPLFFRDGRPKFVMKVPLQLQPNAEYPDGLAVWYVKGQTRDELSRAMSEAGAPAGPPEAGAIIQITHTGTRPAGPGMNPAKLFQVTYRRPDGTAPAAAPVQPQQPAPTAQQPMPQPPPEQFVQQPQQFAPPQAQPVQQPMPQAPQQFVPVSQPATQPQPPADLSPEQQALLAKLTGG